MSFFVAYIIASWPQYIFVYYSRTFISLLFDKNHTVVYSTCARDNEPKSMIDFAPLSVEYQERFSSAGMTSGGFKRREGAPAEHEILVSRIIDRPLRPLICDGWKHETQASWCIFLVVCLLFTCIYITTNLIPLLLFLASVCSC